MHMTMTTFRPHPRTAIAALALLCGVVLAPLAQAQNVYLCVDANGRRELTDSYKTGCKALDIAGAIPAPAQASPARRARTATPVPTPTPTDFPKVDNAQQRARDNDRREILAEELRQEQARLGQLSAEFKGGEPDRLGNERNYAKYQERVATLRDSISRSERNIEALRRELAAIK